MPLELLGACNLKAGSTRASYTWSGWGARKHILARSSFCVVAITLENSWMAGRNFSCKSQILELHQPAQRSGVRVAYKSAAFASQV